MSFFSSFSKKNLTKAALFQNAPVYVQFYITARCNLTCRHCNIIYANSDVHECSLDQIKRIADNLRTIGVPIVLLTGGEPFVRKDLPDIVREFESRGIHVRMQTNGLAGEEQIHKAVEYGGKDISVSLDTLNPELQDAINGGFDKSWYRTIKAIAAFTRYLPRESSFASLGCVLQHDNIKCVENVIRFGTSIGWFTSLVPVHTTDNLNPLGFRSFDEAIGFESSDFEDVDRLIERIRTMQREGYLLYDSDQYLDDIKRFVRGEPVTWRRKNKGLCDTPNLYFVVLPNGDFAPCCDYRLPFSASACSPDFPEVYRSRSFRDEVSKIAGKCGGCMYGSFPEMTISMRYLTTKLKRARMFLASSPRRNWPMDYDRILAIAEEIRDKKAQCGISLD